MNPAFPIDSLIISNPAMLLELFLKILFLSAFFIYMVFSFMVIRQIKLMENTYNTALGPILQIFAIAHFLVAVGVFVFALLVL